MPAGELAVQTSDETTRKDSSTASSAWKQLARLADPTCGADDLSRGILGEFFFVCWPYRARPSEPGRVSGGWQCVGVDQQSGRFGFTNADPDESVNTADRVYLRYDGRSTPVAMIVPQAR